MRIVRLESITVTILRVQVEPMASHVDRHGQLEPEHVLRIEEAECHKQSHCAASVSQLIQHCTEFGA